MQNAITNVAESPTWIGTRPKFWYRKSVKDGNQFVVADAAAGVELVAAEDWGIRLDP